MAVVAKPTKHLLAATHPSKALLTNVASRRLSAIPSTITKLVLRTRLRLPVVSPLLIQRLWAQLTAVVAKPTTNLIAVVQSNRALLMIVANRRLDATPLKSHAAPMRESPLAVLRQKRLATHV